MADDELQFEWDDDNIREFQAHHVTTAEFEQVLNNNPVWLDTHSVAGEQRDVGVGHTDSFRILIVIWVDKSEYLVRPVTAYEANARVRREYQNRER